MNDLAHLADVFDILKKRKAKLKIDIRDALWNMETIPGKYIHLCEFAFDDGVVYFFPQYEKENLDFKVFGKNKAGKHIAIGNGENGESRPKIDIHAKTLAEAFKHLEQEI